MTTRWMMKTAIWTTVVLWLGTWAIVAFGIWFEPYAEKVAVALYKEEDGTWQ